MGRYALIRLPLLLVALLLMTFASSAQAGLLVLSYHDVRDDVAAKGDPDRYAVSTSNFAAHLDWLRSHAYHPVSVQQVLDARAGKRAPPSRPVLLTFDDGLRSVYTRVFPLLQAYGYPALVAPVTSWVELPAGQVVPYGHRDFTHEDFVTWAQLRGCRTAAWSKSARTATICTRASRATRSAIRPRRRSPGAGMQARATRAKRSIASASRPICAIAATPSWRIWAHRRAPWCGRMPPTTAPATPLPRNWA